MRLVVSLLLSLSLCLVSFPAAEAKEASKPLVSVKTPPPIAKIIASRKDRTLVPISRVVRLAELISGSNQRVVVAVEELGGRRDVASQRLFFTLYYKNETFDADAAFDLGTVYCLRGVRQIDNALYAVSMVGVGKSGKPVAQELEIDAASALIKLTDIECATGTCEAATKFASTIAVTTTVAPDQSKVSCD